MRRPSSRLPAIDSALSDRFAEVWAKLWPERSPVGLAVSGGPDSLALLLLAADALPGRFLVATVDHGLRSQSAAEAAYVAAICAARGIAHAALPLQLERGSALQERAREARYAALGDWAEATGLAAIVTAHHADDQAETFLMRLNRGAGVRGLAAMRARSGMPGRPNFELLRPLLEWRRSELAQIVAEAGLPPVQDPSNSDPRFERVRVRAALAGATGLDPLAVVASTRHLAEADAALEWAARRCLAEARMEGKVLCWTPADTPRAVGLRVLERIVALLGEGTPRGSALARWHDRLVAGEIATLAGVRGDGREEEWRFTAAPPPRVRPTP